MGLETFRVNNNIRNHTLPYGLGFFVPRQLLLNDFEMLGISRFLSDFPLSEVLHMMEDLLHLRREVHQLVCQVPAVLDGLEGNCKLTAFSAFLQAFFHFSH